jgi:hypothetical protein
LLGEFLPSQIVRGGLLTCTSVVTTLTASTCNGPMLNGLQIGPASAGLVTVSNFICNWVTGQAALSGVQSGTLTDPYVGLSGTDWVLAHAIAGSQLAQVGCARP